MKNYLTNRKQSVNMNGLQSDYTNIDLGVGQGTILGPTLFKIYIYDFIKSTDGKIIQFADDTTLFISADNSDNLKQITETELEKIEKWFTANKLTLNHNKTRVMMFSPEEVSIKLNNVELDKCGNNKQEKSFNMLGILLDQKLNWDQQIEKVRSKIETTCYLLRKVRHLVNHKTKQMLWNAFANCHINYGITIWGHSCGPVMKNLGKSIKKSLRLIAPNLFHTEPLMKKYNILSLQDTYKKEITKMAWNYHKKLHLNTSNHL